MASYKSKKVSQYHYAKEDYTYQPKLTETLKKVKNKNYRVTQSVINEIVLWKVDRYAELDQESLDRLNAPEMMQKTLDIDFTTIVLKSLLSISGIRLPMASTILRFRNPDIYQIIDQRAYRMVYPKKVLKHSNNVDNQIALYLDYLEKLGKICEENTNWDFRNIDRILYLKDKEFNKKLIRKEVQ
jgi:hypothetical protein